VVLFYQRGGKGKGFMSNGKRGGSKLRREEKCPVHLRKKAARGFQENKRKKENGTAGRIFLHRPEEVSASSI